MATKNFAIPLDSNSKQLGDITMKSLADAGTSATFELTFVKTGGSDSLDLITSKNGVPKSHTYSVSIIGNTASVNLSKNDLATIYGDADGGDWDYVQAQWNVGLVDYGGASNNYQIQNGQTYNGGGWPPIV